MTPEQKRHGSSLPDLHNPDCLFVTHNGKCDCPYGPVIESVITSMRSACVEKVRVRARAHRRIASAINYGKVVDVPVPAEQHCRLADELDAVANELELVSIQEQEPHETDTQPNP